MSDRKSGKHQKQYTQNLTRCKILNSKSDAWLKRCFKVWQVVNFLTLNLTRCIFSIQTPSPKENFNSKSCILKKHEKRKLYRFHGVKRSKTWFFGWKQFFQNLTCRKILNSKSNALYFFQSKIWRVVKPLNQNLGSFQTFSPISEFYLVFQVLTEWWYLLSTLIQTYFKEEN